jgi:hypothetical protein
MRRAARAAAPRSARDPSYEEPRPPKNSQIGAMATICLLSRVSLMKWEDDAPPACPGQIGVSRDGRLPLRVRPRPGSPQRGALGPRGAVYLPDGGTHSPRGSMSRCRGWTFGSRRTRGDSFGSRHPSFRGRCSCSKTASPPARGSLAPGGTGWSSRGTASSCAGFRHDSRGTVRRPRGARSSPAGTTPSLRAPTRGSTRRAAPSAWRSTVIERSEAVVSQGDVPLARWEAPNRRLKARFRRTAAPFSPTHNVT